MTDNKLQDLDMLFGFEDWAKERGYALDRRDDDTMYTNVETQAAWLGFEAAHGPAGCRPQGQQLYGLIKKSSEYSHQADKLFPVRVCKAPYDDYVVHGGPGGVYRLRDMNFYVIEDGKQYRLN
ncbi:hypothetical protein [Pseudomonas sp. UBA4194]|uniref:hypothetical protein n=1 Tax=Pseudomonas sp. UBA4194 TaxID=1947317 RepID=UPI0025D31412|nr:hypothetical protein [Pseudomonas sp. UBA4194]